MVMVSRMLLARVGTRLCGLRVEDVVETMRPLPIEPMADAPPFVRGLAIIRGAPTPVVDTAALLGASSGGITRFVVVRAGARAVALEVDTVVDVRSISGDELARLPPLVGAADPSYVAVVGMLDAELLVVLEAARIVA
jgi:purine-binding chemotaxis protein CheW